MTAPHDARTAGVRVEQLLEQLRDGPEPQAAVIAEELVRCLVRLYGAGLERVVDLVGPELAHKLCADPLVESLLLVHDLHPLDPDTRIRGALDRLRPRLESSIGELDYLGIDGGGVVHVRVVSSGGHGCQSSIQPVRLAIEEAIEEAAPEATGVEVEAVTVPAPAPLLQISLRPGMAS